MSHKSLYDILSVARDVSDADLKSAYRKLARKHHPDVNPDDPAAEQRFKEISAAYDVLSDPERRKLYDEFGEDATKTGFDPEKARAYSRWQKQASPGRGSDRGSGFGFESGGGVDLGDLFGDLLRNRGQRPRRAGPQRGADIEATLEVDLRSAAQGTTQGFRLARPDRCSACEGAGAIGPVSTCPTCNGTGGSQVAQGPLRFQAPCGECDGTGRRAGPDCGVCAGQGAVERTVTIDVKIPAGTEDGQRLRLGGQGGAGRRGGPAGDLLITVRLAPHPVFERDGLDLRLLLPITVKEAMFGGVVDVPTLEDEVELKVPAGSNSGRKLRLRQKGLPGRGGKRGDLYVTLQVHVPAPTEADADAARNAAEALEGLYGKELRRSLQNGVRE